MHKSIIDMTGQEIGKLKVLSLAESKSSGAYFNCKCECGKLRTASGCELRSEKVTSCGCDNTVSKSVTHGLSGSGTYDTWGNMKERCNNVNSKSYKHYGGRGIKICKRWQDFENFYADMCDRPKGWTIERINNDGNYEPSNCRWANRTEQNKNKRNNIFLEYNGKTKIIADWAREFGISGNTIAIRLKKGWTIEEAITTPSWKRIK